MSGVLSATLPFFGLVFLGFAAAKLWRLPAEGLAWLNVFIIYVALPALLFSLIARTPFEELSNPGFVAATTLATAAAFAASFAIGVLASRGNVPEATVQGVLGAYANVGYMGPGLTLSVLGPAAAVPTALILSFDNALLFTLVPLLMAWGGGRGLLETARVVLGRILLHPFIMATVAGVLAAYFRIEPPGPIAEMLALLRGAAGPCALFALGVTVGVNPLGRFPRELPALLAVKLALHPAIAYLAVSMVPDLDPIWAYTAVLMAALPPALNVFVIAQQYGTYVQRASGGILVGTLASVVTVTALIWAVKTGALPARPF